MNFWTEHGTSGVVRIPRDKGRCTLLVRGTILAAVTLVVYFALMWSFVTSVSRFQTVSVLCTGLSGLAFHFIAASELPVLSPSMTQSARKKLNSLSVWPTVVAAWWFSQTTGSTQYLLPGLTSCIGILGAYLYLYESRQWLEVSAAGIARIIEFPARRQTAFHWNDMELVRIDKRTVMEDAPKWEDFRTRTDRERRGDSHGEFEGRPQSVDISTWCDTLSGQRFGGHVLRRADQNTRQRVEFPIEWTIRCTRKSKVQNLDVEWNCLRCHDKDHMRLNGVRSEFSVSKTANRPSHTAPTTVMNRPESRVMTLRPSQSWTSSSPTSSHL